MTPEQQDPAALRWQLGNHTTVAYSTAQAGDQRNPAHRTAWLETLGLKQCVIPRQIHGALIVDAHDQQLLAQADGVVSRDPHQALGVFGADCPGLVIDSGDVLGVAHCGWRGVAADIVDKLVAAMAKHSTTKPAQWHALIGPGISGKNYEVDQPVLSACSWPAAAVKPGKDGHAQLNLAEAIASFLRNDGVQSIHNVAICTAEDQRLWSYRRQGPGLVQALIAWRTC